MFRRIIWLFIGLTSGLFIMSLLGFFIWRIKAPTWQGQSLQVTIDVADDFEILLMGDMGTGDANQKRIAAAMERHCQQSHSLKAIVFLGDNFYPVGVNSVDDPQWEDKFHGIYNTPCLKKTPFFALLGNHDYRGSPAAQIQHQSRHEPIWSMPHRFYQISFGKRLDLVLLDTNVLDLCGFPERCTIDFMLKVLRESSSRNRLVLGHHPIASASQKYPKPNLQSRVLMKLLCDKADSFIAGHSHHLEHRKLGACGMDTFIVGGGGAELYQVVGEDPASLYAQSTFGFLSLKVGPKNMEYAFYDADLKRLYSTIH